jgi:hypothetical protein
MNCSAVEKVTAYTYSEVIKSAFFTAESDNVGKRLSWMKMTAVTAVDNGNTCIERCRSGSTLNRMTYCDNIGIFADNCNCIF